MPPRSRLFPYTTLFRSEANGRGGGDQILLREGTYYPAGPLMLNEKGTPQRWSRLAAWDGERTDRKSTRLNSSHLGISYAVFCLKKKKGMNQATSAKIRR